ncbi:hypothetical protein R5R35_008397 [Gryllus longicercus]|uniref:Large ribosomal subunit protein mL39 n=1 Tax=Gryllus longicercus TaxID=2509291 RepID=A0AAN9VLM3_9ORTH
MPVSVCTLLTRCAIREPTFSRVFRRFSHKYSRNEDVKSRRNEMFTAEKKRQREAVGRVEKIEVKYLGVPQDTTLVMNKNISTPFNCAQHISELVVKRSALALLDGVTLWDMHRPLEAACTLQLLHFKDSDPFHVNKAFWRTCSVVLGAVVTESFKEDIPVFLHSFPSPNVRSGSFVYDIELNVENWVPTKDELRVLTGQMVHFCQQGHKIERLEVSVDLALDMFADNPYKSQQIPDIGSHSLSGDKVILYRVGQHVDISKGPLIGNTNLLGRCSIVAVHLIKDTSKPIYRFQGVALPQGLLLNHFAYGVLENRAKILNPARFIPASDL